MYTYKMIHLKPLGEMIYSKNKDLLVEILNHESNSFMNKQLDLLLYSMDEENDFIYQTFKERSDYTRNRSIHHIHNTITGKDSYCFVDKYAILFKSDIKNNIFYDILYQNLEFYVILVE